MRVAQAILLAIGWFSAGGARADVYVSYQEEHVPRFASHPLDASYRLLIRDEAPVVQPGAPTVPLDPALVKRRFALDPLIARIALRHAVDAALVRAIVEVESRFNVNAVSPKGAVGPMQLMPQTARRYGVGDRMNTLRNVEAGVAYLKDLLARFEGNTALALAAYNAGERAVIRHRNGIPPYRETMLYVPQVLAAYARYRDEQTGSGN
jgi:soluble lytic murein transglycosylase-like protein